MDNQITQQTANLIEVLPFDAGIFTFYHVDTIETDAAKCMIFEATDPRVTDENLAGRKYQYCRIHSKVSHHIRYFATPETVARFSLKPGRLF